MSFQGSVVIKLRIGVRLSRATPALQRATILVLTSDMHPLIFDSTLQWLNRSTDPARERVPRQVGPGCKNVTDPRVGGAGGGSFCRAAATND